MGDGGVYVSEGMTVVGSSKICTFPEKTRDIKKGNKCNSYDVFKVWHDHYVEVLSWTKDYLKSDVTTKNYFKNFKDWF